MKKLYTGLLISLMTTATFAQETPLYEVGNNSSITPESNIKNVKIIGQNNFQARLGIVHANWTNFDKNQDSPDRVLYDRKAEFGLSENDDMQLKYQNVDKIGIEHHKFQQVYKGVPVEGAEYIIHSTSDKIWGNGRLVYGIESSVTPSISEEKALQKALAYIGSENYYWQDPSMENFIKDVKNNPDATFYPNGGLIFASKEHSQDGAVYQLLWKFDIYAHGDKMRELVYVNANSGNIAYAVDGIEHCDTEVTASTTNYGQQQIIVDSVAPDTAYLKDCTRGGGIETYNINNGFSFQFDDPINLLDNVPGGADAHWGAEMVYDFYLNRYGLNSFDGNGSKMVTLINFGPTFMGGSIFTGIATAIGGGTMPFIELVGHEFSHGVSAFTAGLFSFNESGALNESFSNILGTAIEYWALPETAGWLFASLDPTRYNMSDPNASLTPINTHYPDTYMGNYWLYGNDQNAIIHNNASVQDYCFYLLSDGGSGTNDNGDIYSVDAIGIENAADIFYRAITIYLTSTSEFIDSRQATIQSAIDLYGECSNEVQQLINAWYAVGVGPDDYNQDLSLNALISPSNNCDLSDEEIVEVEVLYNSSGCTEIIPSGTEIEMTYQLDENEPVAETWTLNEDFVEGETLNFSFSETISLPVIGEEHNLTVWMDYPSDEVSMNNGIFDFKVERKFEYDGNIMGFEDFSPNNNGFYIHTGTYARAEIDTVAKNTGEKGFLMTVIPGQSNPHPVPEDPSLNFDYQKELISEICFCVDAQDWENVSLYFDLKQTYSMLYNFIYGNDSSEFLSSMRMLINGEQFGEQFHPETYFDDPFVTYNYDLSQLAGTYFEFCFQSKSYVDDAVDNSVIFTYDSQGDNTFLDNILFADQVFTGINESETSDFSIYPNPANDKVYITSNKGTIISGVNIYNQVGQKVLHDSNPTNPLDISALGQGLYIIEIVSDKTTVLEKLIVR